MSIYMRTSVDNLVDVVSVYTSHRLALDPATAPVLAGWKPDVARLTGAKDALDDALREQLRVRAQRDWEELKVRNVLRAFANRIAELGNGSRGTAVYQTYYPTGFSKVARRPLEDLLLSARTILARLEAGSDASLQTAGEQIAAAVAAAERIEAAYQAATADVATKRAELHAARIAWVGAIRRVEGELTVLYPQDRALVRSFFYKRRVVKKKDLPEIADTPEAMTTSDAA